MLKSIIQGIKLGGADKFLGLIFGFAEGIVVVSLILFILHIQPLFDSSVLLSDSIFAGFLLPLITGEGSITNV
jgi:membrane protein required for colicin V production